MSIPKMAKAMGYIDDDLVSGAIEYKREKKKNTWVKWGAMAACLCLVVVAITTIIPSRPSSIQDPSDGTEAPSSPGEMAPFVYVNDTLYKRIKFVSSDDVNDECVYLGEISSKVSSSQEPSVNFQANDDLIGAKIYKAGNDIIVVYNDYYELYSPTK